MNLNLFQFELPPDCTFTPGGMLVHKDTLKRLIKLIEKAKARDPSMFDLYIYNGDLIVYSAPYISLNIYY